LFLISPSESRFITSDNPVLWQDFTAPPHSALGLASKNTVLSFPLGPEVALVSRWREYGRLSHRVPEEVVNSINGWRVRTAARYIFAARRDEAEAALAARRYMEEQGGLVGPRHGPLVISEDESEDPS